MPAQFIVLLQYFAGFFVTYFLYAKAFNVKSGSREATALMLLVVLWPAALLMLLVVAILVSVEWLEEKLLGVKQ
jgi:Na+/proline symporter